MLMTDQHQNIKSSGVQGTKRLRQTQPRRAMLLLDSASSTSPSHGPLQDRTFPAARALAPNDSPAAGLNFDPEDPPHFLLPLLGLGVRRF